MKQLTVREEIFTGDKQGHVYIEDSAGVIVHDVEIDAGLGEEVTIGHIADIHYNYCNQQDLDEADPVLMSTLENRLWLKDGYSVQLGRNAYALMDDPDLMVFNGDTLDYLSHGTMELMQREVWDRYPDAIATMGGHDIARCMEGKVRETMSLDERVAMAQAFWKHDMYYVKRILKDKVMVLGLCNLMWNITAEQLEKFKADIAEARDKGYAVLVFMHEPICTGNPEDALVVADSPAVLKHWYGQGFPRDFYRAENNRCSMVGGVGCTETTDAFYDVLINSADVVKGVFGGHVHIELYFDIIAKTPDGQPATIPQFVKIASAYGDGSIMRITVK